MDDNCINYSGCKVKQYQCPNGNCVDTINECTQIGVCPIDRPFTCGGLICVE